AVRDQPKWQLALDQLLRLHRNGVRFDGLTFDEGYGGKVPWLALLNLAGQKFVAEVPVSFAVRAAGFGGAPRADEVLTAADAKRGRCYRISRHTRPAARWRAAGVPVRVRGPGYTLGGAINEATAEGKYCVTNGRAEPMGRVLPVAFRRATVAHSFRGAKGEAGLMPYEGRRYVGLIRHVILGLMVLGFVAVPTDRRRGEKPAGDAG